MNGYAEGILMAELIGEFVCPACSARLRVRERGRSSVAITCPECQTALQVERNASGQLVALSSVPSPSAQLDSPFAPPRRQGGNAVWIVGGAVCLVLGLIWLAQRPPQQAPADTDSVAQNASAENQPDPAQQALLPKAPGPQAPGMIGPQLAASSESTPAPAVSKNKSNGEPAPSAPAGGVPTNQVSVPQTSEFPIFAPEADRAEHPFAQRLNQLGNRVSAYREEHSRFPPSVWEQASLQQARPFSWLAGLDPALERDANLLPQWNLPWDDPLNDRFVRRKREDLLNPDIAPQASVDRYPASHVVGIAGVGAQAADLPKSDPRAGIFGWNRSTRVEDVRDGLSNTLLAAGVSQRPAAWADGKNSIRGLTSEPYVNGPDGLGTGQQDGMYVLLADGSVRFLNKATAPVVVRRLAAMADGLPLDPNVPGEPGDVTLAEREAAPAPGTLNSAGKFPHTKPAEPAQSTPGTDPAPVAAASANPAPNSKPETTGRGPEMTNDDKQASGRPTLPADAPPSINIEARLKETVLAYQMTTSVPLEQVLAELEALFGIPIEFEANAIPVEDPRRQQPVSLSRRNATYGHLLQDALDTTPLTWKAAPQRILIVPRENEE